ncbi:hypothetical protein [Sphingobacterium tabacisoli]|uniref:Uncharacterized protein n=1 Tax=Sphingobacterium tabacisoli TaxID=2044855 RepID=A0ABW5L217_9SPHI|nr:hypothetical protein [Sphingobacterium tabacisoli]
MYKSKTSLFARFKTFSYAFFNSWYGYGWILLLLDVLSALVITFFTTEKAIIVSLWNKAHLYALGLNILLLLPVVLSIAMLVYAMDTSRYWRRSVTSRWALQGLLLLMVLPLLCTATVYGLYRAWLGVDLLAMGYLQRDFVVLLGIIVLLQVYFKVRKEELNKRQMVHKMKRLIHKQRRTYRFALHMQDRMLKNEGDHMIHRAELLLENARLGAELKQLQEASEKLLQAERDRMDSMRPYARFSWGMLQGMLDKVDVSFDHTTFESVYVRFISSVFFVGSGAARLFYVRMMDGRKGMIAISSLAMLKEKYAAILTSATRDELVNVLALIEIEVLEDKGFLHRLGGDPIAVARDRAEKLKLEYVEVLSYMDGAKELLGIGGEKK